MPFFPLTRIILLTLAFYLDFLSQIFPKLCAFEIAGRLLCFRIHRLLPYSVVYGKVGLVWNAFMCFYPIYFLKNFNFCKFLFISFVLPNLR